MTNAGTVIHTRQDFVELQLGVVCSVCSSSLQQCPLHALRVLLWGFVLSANARVCVSAPPVHVGVGVQHTAPLSPSLL